MTAQPGDTYDNGYSPHNVYGKALALLREHAASAAPDSIHLDVACGFGRIAEPLVEALGCRYVGVDAGIDGLASLGQRGFENHEVLLGGRAGTLATLQRIVGGRKVHSISFLDCLEHLVDGDEVTAALGDLARAHNAVVVISVPNIAHRDVAAKLLFGQWDYTEAGLLDHTHVRLFDERLFLRVLKHAGLFPVAREDVLMRHSDQHFPPEHPAFGAATVLHALIDQLQAPVHSTPTVNQFVALCASGPTTSGVTYSQVDAIERPFLSVVIRTQGRRPQQLSEALLCLAGQSDQDFEVLVIGHQLGVEEQKSVEAVIEDVADGLRARIALVLVADGGRTRPLNVGYQRARGQYVVSLDDDDLVFSHWVETFHKLANAHPGQALRAACFLQNNTMAEVHGRPGARVTGTFERKYPQEYDPFDHVRDNRSPNLSIAVPRGAFHQLGLVFDETLTTAEDWDYFQRVFALTGVASSREFTCIYRWWADGAGTSREVHAFEEWKRNHDAISAKQDRRVTLLPPGAAARLRSLLELEERTAAAKPNALVPTSPVVLPWQSSARKVMKRALRRDIRWCQVKRLLVYPLARRRRKYDSRIRAFRDFLSQL